VGGGAVFFHFLPEDPRALVLADSNEAVLTSGRGSPYNADRQGRRRVTLGSSPLIIFEDKRSASSLATAITLRASEDWALRRYMDMAPLKALYITTVT